MVLNFQLLHDHVSDRDNRRVTGTVVRASAQSPLAGVDITKFRVLNRNLRLFIPETNNTDAVPVDIIDNEIHFIFKAKDEKELQRRLINFLKEKGIGGVNSRHLDRSGTRARPVKKPATRRHLNRGTSFDVQEQNMPNLLNSHGNDVFGEEERPKKKLRRVAPGLPITMSSLCDVSVRVKSGGQKYQDELVVGELKHRGEYAKSQCEKQALIHMSAVFYWLRVTMGLPAQSVYGFAVCGPKCKDIDFHSVTLLKMSAPACLGGEFIHEKNSHFASHQNDTTPIKTLVQFLKNGNRGMSSVGDPLPLDRRGPFCFALPLPFWGANTPDYELVAGGTVAIVFRATWKGVSELLADNQSYKKIFEQQVGLSFEIIEKTKNLFRQQRFPHYVKFQVNVVSHGTTHDFCKLDRNEISDELKNTYPLEPFANDDAYCLIMRNRGEPAQEIKFSSFDQLKTAFKRIWDTALELCKILPPCDTLVHNMVYDGQSLHLIDVDEGRKFGDEIKERIFDEDGGGKNGTSLMYPNLLRSRHNECALVQLAVSLLTIVVMNKDVMKKTDSDDQKRLLDLEQNLEELLNALISTDRKNPYEDHEDLPDQIENPLVAIGETMRKWFFN